MSRVVLRRPGDSGRGLKPHPWAIQRRLIAPEYRRILDQIVGLWPIWSGGGDQIQDVSGNGIHLTRNWENDPNPEVWAHGAYGTVLRTPNVDAENGPKNNTAGSVLDFATTDSLSFMVVFEGWTDTVAADFDQYFFVWADAAAGGVNDGWGAVSEDATGGAIVFTQGGNTAVEAAANASALNDGALHVLVCTWDQVAGVIRVYVDGALDYEVTGYTDTSAVAANQQIALFGTAPDGTVNDASLNGTDYIMGAAWRRELPAAQVGLLADPFGLVTMDLGAALFAGPVSVTVTTDLAALIQRQDQLVSTSLGGAVQAQDLTKTVSLSALVQLAGLTISANLDGSLRSVGVLRTASLDAAIQSPNLLRTVLLDAILKATVQLTLSADAAIQSTGEIKTLTLDAAVQLAGLTVATGVDAKLKALAITTITDLDAAVQATGIGATTVLDAALKALGITRTASLDAALALLNVTSITALDAVLSLPGTKAVTTDLDALLKALGVTRTVSLDAALQAIDRIVSTGLDSAIQLAGATRVVDLDAVLLLQDRTINTALDGLLLAGGLTVATSLDARLDVVGEVVLIKPSWLGSYGQRMWTKYWTPFRDVATVPTPLQASTSLLRSAMMDAVLQTPGGPLTASLDALLAGTTSRQALLDAIVSLTAGPTSVDTTLDAALGKLALTLNLNMDARVSAPALLKTASLDAFLALRPTTSLDAAVLLEDLTLSAGLDASIQGGSSPAAPSSLVATEI